MINRLIEYSARNKFLVLLLIFFASAWGLWALFRVPLDAIPDLSDVQVIVFTEWPGRSPDIMEDQITYPIITQMISAPKVKFVRGQSFFGLSWVYVVFRTARTCTGRAAECWNTCRGLAAGCPKG